LSQLPPQPEEGVHVIDDTGVLSPAQLAFVQTHAWLAIRALNARGEVRVRIVNDQAMSQAHEEYAGVTGTTDVLTFDMSNPVELEAGETSGVWVTAEEVRSSQEKGFARTAFVLDTDILACADEASRQASERGYALERELLLYVVHGVLHCLGYDDHDEVEAGAMHRLEDVVLAAIGVGITFDTHPKSSGG